MTSRGRGEGARSRSLHAWAALPDRSLGSSVRRVGTLGEVPRDPDWRTQVRKSCSWDHVSGQGKTLAAEDGNRQHRQTVHPVTYSSMARVAMHSADARGLDCPDRLSSQWAVSGNGQTHGQIGFCNGIRPVQSQRTGWRRVPLGRTSTFQKVRGVWLQVKSHKECAPASPPPQAYGFYGAAGRSWGGDGVLFFFFPGGHGRETPWDGYILSNLCRQYNATRAVSDRAGARQDTGNIQTPNEHPPSPSTDSRPMMPCYLRSRSREPTGVASLQRLHFRGLLGSRGQPNAISTPDLFLMMITQALGAP